MGKDCLDIMRSLCGRAWRSLFHPSGTKISFKPKQSPNCLYRVQFAGPYCVAALSQIYALPHHKFLNKIREAWSKKYRMLNLKKFLN